jgi:UDP-glucose 4-epimerase
MNLFVTGASGFIGLNLLERLLAQGHRVTAVSSDEIPSAARAEFERLPGKLETARADVRDAETLERLLRSSGAEAIVAGAAITSNVARERETPAAIFEVNLSSVVKLIELAARQGVRRLVALSSSAAIGERIFGERPVAEEDPPAPVSLYAIGKAALEAAARRWRDISPGRPEVVVARVAAVFGPWERATGVRDMLSPLYSLATAAVRGTPVAPLPHGGKRDWVYAPYVAAALEWMLTAPRLEHSLYNVDAGATWHPRDFAACGLHLKEQAGAPEVSFNDDLSRTRTYLDMRRLSREFQPPPAPEAAASSYARWIASHTAWFNQP